MTIRIFLLDDHEVVRRGLRELLESEEDLTVVGEAGTAEEAYGRIPATSPNVAVLDVRLPDGDGIEVCREVRSKHPEIACLMLTSYADDEAVYAAIMAGAAGYVLKQVRGTDLVDAIRRVGGGESLLDPAVTARVLERMRKGNDDDELSSLTAQERRILDLIAEGLTNRQIGEQMFLAEKTVKNYVSNLLAKLGMSRRTEAAVYAARLAERRSRREQLIPQQPPMSDVGTLVPRTVAVVPSSPPLERSTISCMKRSLDVLLMESRSGIADDEGLALEAAGHRVHRCHEAGDDGFACVGMRTGQSCPLDGPIDVVLLVRRGVSTEPTHVEDGIRCAVRAGVPIVEFGSEVAGPFEPWVAHHVEVGESAVSECVLAADRSLDPLRAAMADRIRPLLVAAGIDPDVVACDVEPVPPALIVHIDIPVAVDRQLEQALGVRVLDAVRSSGRTYGQVRVLVHQAAVNPAESR